MGNVVSIDERAHRERVLERAQALAAAHLDLVRQVAWELKPKLPAAYDFDDLISAGHEGLYRAALSYQPERFPDVPFAPYAARKIKFAMLDAVDGPNGRNWKYATLNVPLRAAEESGPRVLPLFEDELDGAGKRARVAAAIRLLTAQEQKVVTLYYSPAEPTMQEIADEMDITLGRVSQLHSQAVARLKAIMRAAA